MPLGEYFDKNTIKESNSKKKVPDGVWTKCKGCGLIIFEKELIKNDMVCPKCDFHHLLAAKGRIEVLVDENSFKEQDKNLVPADKLKFKAEKTYRQSISKALAKSGYNEAFIGGVAEIEKRDIAIGAMDFRFIGGSMGSVVGEKITRLVETAIKKKIPLVISCASGGARMQEGMLSLMQMSKTSQAVGKLGKEKLPYISILTNPTMGGVTASFAGLADIIIAEPGALIGFAGPRVIEKTIKERLPEGFQNANSLKEGGMVDMIVSRANQKDVISKLLGMLREQ